MTAGLEKLEGMSPRSESQPGDELSHLRIKKNVHHVPELGVIGVHGHVQPLQEEFRHRRHVDKVCSL